MDILELLKKLQINYVLHKHLPVFTCEQSKEFESQLKSARTKNLFLKADKSRKHYLYILECETRADLKNLSRKIGEAHLSFSSESDLSRLLHLTPGSVSPFGLANDTNKEVTVLIDSRLKNYPWLSFHPNTNTATVEISWPDFQRFLNYSGQTVIQL